MRCYQIAASYGKKYLDFLHEKGNSIKMLITLLGGGGGWSGLKGRGGRWRIETLQITGPQHE